ncbi:MAG TPA: ATP-grasp domain-containing protein [Solirubrobacteraceae bacterium]
MSGAPEATVLVLGVGGSVSQGILKALALSSLRCRVVAACVTPDAMALQLADRAYVSPLADDPAFLDWLSDVCRREGVQGVLSGSEHVLAVLSRHAAEIRERSGAVCLVSSPEVLEVGADKLGTARWLQSRGLAFPRSAAADDEQAWRTLAEECGLPLVVKPRRGKGSAGVRLVAHAGELDALAGRQDLVVQEHVGDDTVEYTAGCLCDAAGELRGTVVLQRTLHSGTTASARAGVFPEVRAEAERIAAALRPVGPLNVQLRLDGERAVAFELNVRFSGTTPIRARLGFNEVGAAVRHLVLGEPMPALPMVTRGAALRYWNELYVAPEAIDELARTGSLEDPGRGHPAIEDWGTQP